MAVIPDKDIATVARAAGFTAGSLETAVAVALAESGGDTTARGDVGIQTSTWGPSVGLWQIRSIKKESGKGTPRDATRLIDPAFNARAAWSISAGGTSWRPWSVYTSGRYLLYRNRAKKGIADSGATASGTVTVDPAAPAIDLSDPLGIIPDQLQAAAGQITAIGDAFTWLSTGDHWIRIAQVVIGGAIIVVGLTLATRPLATTAVKTVAGPLIKGLKGKK